MKRRRNEKIEAINNDEDYIEVLDRFGKLNEKYGINIIMAKNQDNKVIWGDEYNKKIVMLKRNKVKNYV
ncbi:hypothetical protein [Clostridium massiliamazoniense]|uniref:hypothetical protein n=1 Tax=Clostridium massiliamazoniense TaxID=1347366 RepID=UPI0006D7C6C1|nr:hypothetical protein [Clostridium massiliamazoniense]